MANRRIVVEFVGQDKSLSSTARNVDDSTSKLGGRLKSIGKVAALGFAAAGVAVVKFGVDAIGKASDLNETLSKSETIFGKNFATMDTWAKGAATSMGLSRAAALDAASGFGDMFGQLGFAGDEAANMSRKVVQMSADLGSFNNLPTAEVADMMSAAFRGEYDSLQRLIPNINATRVETEALEMTGKKSAATLTAQEKAAATLAIVQKDGARAAGDFEKTSGSLANQQKILSARFENVQAAIGQKLLPVAVDFMTWMNDKFIPGFSKVAKVVLPAVVFAFKAVVSIIKTLGAIGKWLWNNVFQPVFKLLVDAIGKVLQWFGKMLQIIGKVPKMGWVGDLGDKLVNAGDKAENLAGNIRDIPDSKTFTLKFNVAHGPGAGAALGLLGGGSANVGRNARGTSNWRGGLTWVGEEGPELVGLPRGSQVFSNARSRAMAGGGDVAQVNLYLDSKVVLQQLVRLKRNMGRDLGLT